MPRKLKKAKSAYKIPGSMSPGQAAAFKSYGPIGDRAGDQQRLRNMREMQIRESGVGRDGGPSIDDTPARIPSGQTKPFYGVDHGRSMSRNPRQRRRKGNRYYRTD